MEEDQVYLRTVKRKDIKSLYPIYPIVSSIIESITDSDNKMMHVWTYLELNGFIVKIKFAAQFDIHLRDSEAVFAELSDRLHNEVKKAAMYYKPSGKLYDIRGNSIDIKIIENESNTSKSKMEHKK